MSENPEEIIRILKTVRSIPDDATENQLLHDLTGLDAPTVLSFVNAHAINLSWHDSALRRTLIASDVLLRDGIGVEVVLPWFSVQPGLNMNGTDFIPKIITAFRGRRIAVFGTRPPWLDTAANIIREQGGNVVCTSDGFQDSNHYLNLAKEHEPELIVLAMGMPKQELQSQRLKNELDHPCLIVNGGAVIDFMAGKVSRAPVFIRRMKMEWLYRLALEPRRMFDRYVIGNPLFLWRCHRLRRTSP